MTDTKPGQDYTKLSGKKSSSDNAVDLSTLTYHTQSIEEVCTSLSVDPLKGLDKQIAQRRFQKYGPNKITPPSSNLFKKIFFYFFGGFGSILIFASLICFISWKPLGNPNPQVSNLALAIVLLVVVFIQAGFNAWQG